MKKHLALIFTLFFITLISGCVGAGSPPKMTQLQIRQMQTREYEAPKEVVIEASLGFLQDEGYIIKNANEKLGIVYGTKEVDVESGWNKFFGGLSKGLDGDNDVAWDKNSVHEISVNVRGFGKKSKVRVISQVKIYDTRGAVSKVAQITDEEFYKNIFYIIDKGVFLHQEGL